MRPNRVIPTIAEMGHLPDVRVTGQRQDSRVMKQWVAAALTCGGLAVAGLVTGTARADDDCGPAAMVDHVCWGPNRWCPGDSLLHLTQNHVYQPVTWDMSVCHTYYHVAPEQANQGQGIYEGPNPPPPQSLPGRGPYLPPPPGTCWNMWIPGPCPGG